MPVSPFPHWWCGAGDDQLLPLAEGKDYAAKIPGAKLVIVPECGHAPSLEKPKEFLEAVEGFLGR